MSVRAKICQSSTLSVINKITRGNIVKKLTISETISINLRSILSAITPPYRESPRVGSKPIALIEVTMNAESVISSTSQPRAIVDMKKDTMEARDANQKNLNGTYLNDLYGPLDSPPSSSHPN